MVAEPKKPTHEEAQLRRRLAPRVRDLAVMSVLCVGVVLLLAVSGALGWVEAITASIVLVAAAMAYYVGSTSPEPVELRKERTKSWASAPSKTSIP